MRGAPVRRRVFALAVNALTFRHGTDPEHKVTSGCLSDIRIGSFLYCVGRRNWWPLALGRKAPATVRGRYIGRRRARERSSRLTTSPTLTTKKVASAAEGESCGGDYGGAKAPTPNSDDSRFFWSMDVPHLRRSGLFFARFSAAHAGLTCGAPLELGRRAPATVCGPTTLACAWKTLGQYKRPSGTQCEFCYSFPALRAGLKSSASLWDFWGI